jgi:glycerate kinase
MPGDQSPGIAMRALVAPASLKGVLSATKAAAALASGLRAGGAETVEMPVADGGEGTLEVLHSSLGGKWCAAEVHDAFGRLNRAKWLELSDGGAAIECAQVIPLDPHHLDAMTASSAGLGEMIKAVGTPSYLIVGLGGSATVDGGSGLREVLDELPAPTRVACDVGSSLLDAARLFAAQKGATQEQIKQLEQRLAGMEELQPYAAQSGAGAAGGLGAALAALGATLMPGAPFVLSVLRFDPMGFDLVITGEGTVDATTAHGKAPWVVHELCRRANVRCAVFGGKVLVPLPGAENYALSGNPNRAVADLVDLGRLLAQ